MKLKNKLIPFAIATTAITAVTPLSVSCSSKNSMRDINSLEAARPDFQPYHSVPAWFDVDEDEQEDTAMKAYIDFVKKDPKRFEQDMAWGVYQNWLSFYDNSNLAIYYGDNITHKFESKINTLEVSITDVSFGTTNILMPHRGSKAYKSYNTVSFKMKLHVNADVNTVEPDGNAMVVTKKNIDTTSTVEYKNMLIFAMQTARDNKLVQFNNPTISTVEKMAYDTTKPGWLITISDNSDNQSIYDNYYEEHGIKYDTNITVNESVRYNDENETVTTSKGHYANNIKKTQDFNELVNEKNYSKSGSLGMFDGPENISNDSTIGRWFHQDAAQIVANSVLLDIWSYYFSNTYTSPKFYFGDNDDTNEYVNANAVVNAIDFDGNLPTFDEWEASAADSDFNTNISNMKWVDSSFGYSDDCEYEWADPGLTLEYGGTDKEKSLSPVGSQSTHMSNLGAQTIEKHFPEEGFVYEPWNRAITLILDEYDQDTTYVGFGSYSIAESKLSNDDDKKETAFHDVHLPKRGDGIKYNITIDRPFFDYQTRQMAIDKINEIIEAGEKAGDLPTDIIDACEDYLPYLDVINDKDYIPFKFPSGGEIWGHFKWDEEHAEEHVGEDPYQFSMSLPDNLVVRLGYNALPPDEA